MIETDPSVQQAQVPATPQLRARMSMAVSVPARQRAIGEVKLALQRQGRRKLCQIARREIVAMANEYLAEHPELISEAKPIVEQWAAEGFFGKRAVHILNTECGK